MTDPQDNSYRRLTETQILAWADAYREATGHWPTKDSGRIAGTVCEFWAGVDRALRLGLLGLPGGSSLAQLLRDRRDVRYASWTPPLTEEQILAWADQHFERFGKWPTTSSGEVIGAHGERWGMLDHALRRGTRGLPGGSSLPRLLFERRGVRNPGALPELTIEQILVWADEFHRQTGKWPTENSGRIANSGGETWVGVDTALRKGTRGLAGGSSLPRLLGEQRGVRNKTNLPDLRIEQILAWADEHLERTGSWPTVRSGPIESAPGETWAGVDAALCRGTRGRAGGTTLARLLADQRRVRNHMGLPRLTSRQILAWADAHQRRTGEWPTAKSGPIPEAPGETWMRVETALRDGLRGLPGGSSLAQLLAEQRDKRNIQSLPPLRVKRIVEWADAHHERTGRWPTRNSGAIPEAPGETWSGVNTALQMGLRGLPKGGSLARLLARKRRVRNRRALPPLTIEQVLAWADRYHEEHGQWPSHSSGAIPHSGGETWRTVDRACRKGDRDLPGGGSLADLFAEHRGHRNSKRLPPLTVEIVRHWAEAHRRATGHWPSKSSGPISGAAGETWLGVDDCFRRGRRGLPGGISLARFLRDFDPEV
jgi:hypothetical protein